MSSYEVMDLELMEYVKKYTPLIKISIDMWPISKVITKNVDL